MAQKKRSGFPGSILKWVIPFGISIAAIWLISRTVNFQDVTTAIKQIGWQPILWASLLYFSSHFARVACWYILLNRKVTYGKAYFGMNAGYLLNNVFPFRLGEIGRAILLGSPSGPTIFQVLSSIIVERVYDVTLAAGFFLGTLLLALSSTENLWLSVAFLAVALFGLVILFIITRHREKVKAWMTRKAQGKKWLETVIVPKIGELLDGFAVFDQPLWFFLSLGLLVVSWLLAFCEQYVIMRALIPDGQFWWVIFILSAGALGAAVPSAPAGLGVYEASIVGTFAVLGVSQPIALAQALVTHALHFVYSSSLGLIGLIISGQNISAFFRRATQTKSKSGAES